MPVAYARILGRQIKCLREAAGLSQYGLAASLGCSQPTVSCWEHGVYLPTLGMLIKMARVLSTTVGHLVHPIDVRLAAIALPVVDQEALARLAHQQRLLAAAALAQQTVSPQAFTMSSLDCGEVYGCEVYGEGT